ncbi:FAD-dependent oxidoreductase [Neobacillus sp. 179-C4.2 HS]|uniref:Glycerol-3-phosphate dehydrogenase n=1 Tax=Neobacillus driksii TaxID=3035913 RepID=A0ABV4YVP0_9BACI|nr:FAD-dependent oxidoreductase [Neobacillus sp. 179.-C4.2 HS]MDP5192313.1 FAD-dependent oxidoreductase [Neobacillus sp. 179.-C4.2 HS]
MKFSNINRNEMIESLKKIEFDVLVIGGGITGAGVALDATTRGMSTALVEMQDFAFGTSSRSTKLIHGGLRYLKQFEIQMVAEVGKEREIVFENGPHVTKPEWMLLPIYQGGTFGRFSTSIGLRVYDFLAGVKKTERRLMLSKEQTLVKEPLLKKEGLIGGGYYVEYRTDDARLTIEVLKKANENGALPINYTKVTGFIYQKNTINGVKVKDEFTGTEYEICAKKIVNAAGPWVEEVRQLDHSNNGKSLQLTKGVHLVIDQGRFPLKQSIYFDTPDNRMVFAIPREGKTYVGTTDTFFNGDKLQPFITKNDRNYLINAINYMFPEMNIQDEDIESSWAGLRPLIFEEGKKASDISRKDEIWESYSGLITIAGGKLTGYRKMAEAVVNLLAAGLSKQEKNLYAACKTKKLAVSGGKVGGSANFPDFISEKASMGVESGLNLIESRQLVSIYGSNIEQVFHLFRTNRTEAIKYGIPDMLFAKLVYALHCEMAATPTDFFIRRTGDVLFDIHSVHSYKKPVIEFMADKLEWNETDKVKFTKELETALKIASGTV